MQETYNIRRLLPGRHHQDSVRRGVRRSQLHSASAEAAKAPYPLAPSSFPNCDRCAGSQFGDTGALPFLEVLFLSNINRKATQRSGRLSERKRKGADMKFSALAGNGMQRVSSDAAAVLFFLQKRKKRMGRKSGGQGRPPLHGAAKTKGTAIGRPIYRSNSTPLNRNRPDIIRAFWYLTSHRSARRCPRA